MTYEQWLADVLRLLKPPKKLDEFEETELVPGMFKRGWDPAGAVVLLQDLRDGGDGIEEDG